MHRRLASLALVVGCAPPAAPVAPSAPAAPSAPTPARGLAYPPAPRGDVVEQHFGVAVPDPYRWLEAMDSPQTRAWVTAETALADQQLAAIPGRERLRARIAELVHVPRTFPPVHRGARYFWRSNDGAHDQAVLYTARTLEEPPTVLFDPNPIGEGGKLALVGFVPSPDGARVAYGLAAGGGDWETWHVRDVATGKDLPDTLPYIKYYAPQFSADGQTLYYSRFPAPQPGKELVETDHDCAVYAHRLGHGDAPDAVVFARPDHPTWQYDLATTRDHHGLVIAIGDGEVGDRGEEQIAYLDLQHPASKPVMLADAFDGELVFAGSDGARLFFKTTRGAPNKRVLAIDPRAPGKWEQIVAEGPDAIDDARVAGHQLFVTTLHDAHSAVTAYDLAGHAPRPVAVPPLASVWGLGGAAPEDRETFYYATSFTAPGTVYRYDLATGASTPWQPPRVAFDPAAFETTQVFFPSKDGTRVPMFVTAKRGLPHDGTSPTIMTAYGFGGIPSTPSFDAPMIAWLERGGTAVLVNIRGGGEYGEAWHLAAKGTHRQTGWDDFIAAGEWLVANHYTTRAHLGIVGTSGGGMLVAGVTMQRPDLFGASAPIAGVDDLLRFQLFGQGAGWQGDLGAPDSASDFPTLRALSPLHNVRAGTRYPAMLVITSDHDVRVPPLHSYKLAAALQAAQAGPAPILLQVDTESGHGGGSTVSQAIAQQTDLLAFFAQHLGLDLTR